MNNLDKLIEDMKNCQQTAGQSVYQHGEAVANKFDWLVSNAEDVALLDEHFCLPDWFLSYRHRLLAYAMNPIDIRLYQLFHDCGKPYCLSIDAEGKRHFEDHAKVSYETWLKHGGDESIGRLILHDMDLHVMKDADIESFCSTMSIDEASILLLTALCEIHANAEMFGGLQSQSFKIKWKQLNKRGKAICKKLFGGEDEDKRPDSETSAMRPIGRA